jgi:hypothetical protein
MSKPTQTKTASDAPETPRDWSRYETVPFAILIRSSITGWIEAARPTENPFKRYEAFDGPKMLLNYGMIVAEKH